ncbi:hypothetical protein TWF506_007202 [Arthrobotrys conoides]|uniref:Uncharacterized protein n=1 Tax=Arthrobotrys conoides TaxID=74498 RepID=A0AAN8NFC6_9PEZI
MLKIKDLHNRVLRISTSAYDIETAVYYELGDLLHSDNIARIRESAKSISNSLRLANKAPTLNCRNILDRLTCMECAKAGCKTCDAPAKIWYQIDEIRNKVRTIYDMIHEEERVSEDYSIPGSVKKMLLEVQSLRRELGQPTLYETVYLRFCAKCITGCYDTYKGAIHRKNVWNMHLQSIYHREVKNIVAVGQKLQQDFLDSLLSTQELPTPVGRLQVSDQSGEAAWIGIEEVQSTKEDLGFYDDITFYHLTM